MKAKWVIAGVAVAAAVGTVFGLSACTTARVTAGQTAIIVDNYVLIPTDPAIIECLQEETSEIYGSVDVYRYPARQISWDATFDPGAEREPYVVVSNAKAPAELLVPVAVTFDLTTDCESSRRSIASSARSTRAGWTRTDCPATGGSSCSITLSDNLSSRR